MAFILGTTKTTALQGETFTITLGTSGLPDGTTVAYSISGIAATDILEPLVGVFTLTSNIDEQTFTVDSNLIGSKNFRLDLVTEAEYITVVLSDSDEYIDEPCHVFTSDKFNDWRRKHNGLCRQIEDVVDTLSSTTGPGGVLKQHYDAAAGQTFFPLDFNVNPIHTIVLLNGHVLDDTDYVLTPTDLTILAASITPSLDDDINLIDFGVGTGFQRQNIDATAGQTVFSLGTAVSPDHTIILFNGHVLDNTDYGLTPTTLTLISIAAEVDDDINIIDFANGQLVPIQRVIKDEGNILPNRGNINFIGAGVTVSDNGGSDETTVLISGGGGGGGGGSGTSLVENFAQTAHGFTVGKAVYKNVSGYVLSDQTSAATAEVVGIVSGVPSANELEIAFSGLVTIGSHGLGDNGDPLYLSTNGDLVSAEPIDGISKPVGSIIDPNTILVEINRGTTVGFNDTTESNWEVRSGNYSPSANEKIIINAGPSGGTITFPTAPDDNDYIAIAQGGGDLSTNPYTLDATSINFIDNIQTPATTFDLNVNFPGRITWVYKATLNAWILT